MSMQGKTTRAHLQTLLVLFFLAEGVRAEAPADPPAPIRDNSFLLEEAYNQEAGVVQHISAFSRERGSGEWNYTFTEECPVRGEVHQVSLTLPIQRPGSENRERAGMGDMLLNYRFQALGGSVGRTAFAPRVSLLLATGDEREGRGTGGTGLQLNLPLSLEIGRRFVAHSNAGATIIPSARNAAGDQARLAGLNLGQSVIWLTRPGINVMLEAAWTSWGEVTGPRETSRTSSFFLAPGVRGAINLRSGLQIVPGIAIPIGLGSSSGERGLFLYLSFEHAY